MPAAAVVPAPIAYTKVVAVKKLVVEFWGVTTGPSLMRTGGRRPPLRGNRVVFTGRAAKP